MGGYFGPMIAVVTQQTRLKGLVARWSTKSAAEFRLRQAHAHRRSRAVEPSQQVAEEQALAAADFDEYEREDVTYQSTLQRLRRELDLGYPIRFVDREFLPNFDFGMSVAAVVLGRDGLVANAAKYVGDLPLVAVNPDPKRVDGLLLPFRIDQARQAVRRVLDGKAKTREVTLAEVNFNDGQRMLAFNDFFVGCDSHASARYTLHVQSHSEAQSSSGMIVATGAGSTGWLSSMFNMVEGFVRLAGSPAPSRVRLAWDDHRLAWAVREPFQSKQSGAELVFGILESGEQLRVESLMPSGGIVFSDGVQSDYLEFNSGTTATFSVSKQRARLVVS